MVCLVLKNKHWTQTWERDFWPSTCHLQASWVYLTSVFCDLSSEQAGKVIALALDVRLLVRLSANPTAYTGDPELEQFPEFGCFFFVCFLFICFVFAICESVWPEYYKTTHIVSNSFSILMFLLFSHSVMSNSLLPHGLQHASLPWPLLIPRACSSSWPLSWWWNPAI